MREQQKKKDYYIAVELGRIQDYTALAIAEVVYNNGRTYQLRHLERLAIGLSYPKVAEHLTALMLKPPLQGNNTITVIDATGVALPVANMLGDLLQRAGGHSTVYYSLITSGDTETHDGYVYRIPRRDLASTLQVMLQAERLKIAPALPNVEQLKTELANFQVNISPPGQTDDLMWREGASDDLVLSVALTCWAGERLDFTFEIFKVYL